MADANAAEGSEPDSIPERLRRLHAHVPKDKGYITYLDRGYGHVSGQADALGHSFSCIDSNRIGLPRNFIAQMQHTFECPSK